MPNEEMTEFWNTRGGDQWATESERYDRLLVPCGERLLAAASLAPGEHVLDVGCGNGSVTIEAARRVGASGRVTGVDISVPMLAVARGRAADSGVSVSFVEADAQTGELGGPYDAVISRFGVMFFDDPEIAFANITRTLKPGGRIVFVCWQEMFKNEWIAVPAMAAVSVVGPPEPTEEGAPGPFAFADTARLERILTSAGLTSVTIEPATDPLVMGSDVDDVVSYLTKDEMGRRLLADKEPELVKAATAAVREALLPFESPDGVVLSGNYWVVSATRP